VSEQYAGRQIVGMDLHRRRSVLVRMTDMGERLETVRISNDPEYLAQVMARAGEAPEVVLEAAYGWYWAADTLAELGATVHLAHPLGVKMFAYRRVKNDQRDAADLADLLRMGRLPEAWIAPPATRELRGWVRHRAKLVGLRSSLKCQVHGVLAHAGSRLVRWAAVEAIQRVGGHTRLGQHRDRVAARRGRNIGVVAAARELLTLVFYGLRDHHIRALDTPAAPVASTPAA
jgi:transposase